jgi:hypothetical protein
MLRRRVARCAQLRVLLVAKLVKVAVWRCKVVTVALAAA